MRPGPLNLITDVAGLSVGHATDERVQTGITTLVGARPLTAAVDVRGGAPGVRETDTLAPPRVLLTGGDARLIAPVMAQPGEIVADLVLRGLAIVATRGPVPE